MKKLSLFLSSLMLIGITITSCKKDDNDSGNNSGSNNNTSATNTDKLCNKNWKFVTAMINFGSFQIPYTLDSMDACDRDNFMRFLTNGTLNFDQGPVKCNPDDAQVESSQWKWYSNETKLIFDGDTADVLTNSGSVLKLKSTYFDQDLQINVGYTVTFGL